MASGDWKDSVLKAHNDLRKKHGAPPLKWSDECNAAAKRQADACQMRGALFHGNTDGPSGRHGQNGFWRSNDGAAAQDVVESWYAELHKPGYAFGNPNYQPGAGHFTQVVWSNTESVGMARSADGQFIFANYFPGGNVIGEFASNVLPVGSSQQSKSQGARSPPTPVPALNVTRAPIPSAPAPGARSAPTPALNVTRAPIPSAPAPSGQASSAKDVGTAWTVTKGQRVELNYMGQWLSGTILSLEGQKVHVHCDVDPVGTTTIVPLSQIRPVQRTREHSGASSTSLCSRCCSWLSGRDHRKEGDDGLTLTDRQVRVVKVSGPQTQGCI